MSVYFLYLEKARGTGTSKKLVGVATSFMNRPLLPLLFVSFRKIIYWMNIVMQYAISLHRYKNTIKI